jgi:hypothetical protein
MESGSRNLASVKRLQSSVNICGCGVVHLNYFNATIRFNQDNFLEFALMVNEAYHRLTSHTSREIEGGPDAVEGLKP